MLYLVTTSINNTPIALVSGNNQNDEYDIMKKTVHEFGFTRLTDYLQAYPGQHYLDSHLMKRYKICNDYKLYIQQPFWFSEWRNYFYLIFKDINFNNDQLPSYFNNLSVFLKLEMLKDVLVISLATNIGKMCGCRFVWIIERSQNKMLVAYGFDLAKGTYPPNVGYIASMPDNEDLSVYPADELFHAMGFKNVSQYIESYPKMFSVGDGGIGDRINVVYTKNAMLRQPIRSYSLAKPTNIVDLYSFRNRKPCYVKQFFGEDFENNDEIICVPTIEKFRKHNDCMGLRYKDLWFCSDWDENRQNCIVRFIKNIVLNIQKIFN